MPDDQMFCDEFIGEVIYIDLLREFKIELPSELGSRRLTDDSVVATVSMGRGPHFERFNFEGRGKTMGFALRSLRTKIQEHYGK